MQRIFRRLALITLIVSSGCSTFNSDWKKVHADTAATDGLAGRWEGSWTSEASGHKGSLRCLLTRIDNSRYNARYRAKYKKIFSFEYTVPMTVTNDGTNYTFTGEADLGKLAGGRYSYNGRATPARFECKYTSKRDYGSFNMARPK